MSHLGKRDRSEFEQGRKNDNSQDHFGVAETVSRLTNAEGDSTADTSANGAKHEADGDWEVAKGRKRHRKNNKKPESSDKGDYPELTHSSHARLQSQVRISDLQALAVYLLADGPSPQWIAIKHRGAVKKVVVLMVPGLEREMFFGDMLQRQEEEVPASIKVEDSEQKDTQPERQMPRKHSHSPDDYYPVRLRAESLPNELKPMAHMFTHLWPVKAPGDSKLNRMHSPLQAMLSSPLPKGKDEREMKGPRPPREARAWVDEQTPITTFLATADELRDAEFTLHPALLESEEERQAEDARRKIAGHTLEEGWVDSKVSTPGKTVDTLPKSGTKDPTAGRKVIAIDCEMCMVDEKTFALARISIVDWSGEVIMDELVKPDKPITDYVTAYSGMTAEKLDPITTTLADIQARLLDILHPATIIIGHSLNSDLDALKVTHPYIVDTSLQYPHPRGAPLKSSLKWLAQKYLSRDVQKGSSGHNSIEDARTALDLIKLKCKRGPTWGTSDATVESIFKRIGRAPKPQSSSSGDHCTSALVDWGFPKRGYGATADFCIGCSSDAEVEVGVKRAILGDTDGKEIPGGGVELVWARMRELEATRGWWTSSKTADNDILRDSVAKLDVPTEAADAGEQLETSVDTAPSSTPLGTATTRAVNHIQSIYAALPPCTAFIVYSGTGDPREYTRLLNQQQQYKREYNVKKWDELSVRWGNEEEKAMVEACRNARDGVGFVCVK